MNFKSYFSVVLLAVATLSAATFLHSCEDDGKTKEPVVLSIAGNYNTHLNMSIATGKTPLLVGPFANQTVTIVPTVSGDAELILPALQAPMPDVPLAPSAIETQACRIQGLKTTLGADSTYTISGKVKSNIKIRLAQKGQAIATAQFNDYQAEFNVKGTLRKKHLSLTISYQPGTMPFLITYTYESAQ